MTRPTRSSKAVVLPAAAQSSTASPWADWPWKPKEAPSAPSRRAASALGEGSKALTDVHAMWVATWMDCLVGAQSSWLDLPKTLPAAMLVPFGWHLKVPAAPVQQAADVANNAFGALSSILKLGRLSTPPPLESWIDAWKPAHTEDFVA